MNATTIALRLCPEAECAAVRERAAAVAAAIASKPGNPCGSIRALYCQAIGDHAGEVQAFQRSAVRASGMYASGAAAVMLGYDRSAETLALMRPVTDSDDGFAVVGRAYLLLDAGRREEAERLYASVADRQVASRPFAEGVLLLAGESDRVAANARRIVTSLPATHRLHPVFRFWAGDLVEQAFLDLAGPSRLAQCATRYFAGMAALGRGERERAISHFREAVATGAHWRQEYQWSRAFLIRMEQDATWPARLQGSSAPRAVSQ
jgi:hypothetical protein